MTPRDTDLAWLAGFFDGEGSLNFSFRRYRPSQAKGLGGGAWVLRIRFCNTHHATILHVADITQAGYVATTPPRRGQRRRVSGLSLESSAAERIVRAMEPYLVTKREQVRLALAAIELRRRAPRTGGGRKKGRPTLTVDTHAQLRDLQLRIQALNGHKPLPQETPHAPA